MLTSKKSSERCEQMDAEIRSEISKLLLMLKGDRLSFDERNQIYRRLSQLETKLEGELKAVRNHKK